MISISFHCVEVIIAIIYWILFQVNNNFFRLNQNRSTTNNNNGKNWSKQKKNLLTVKNCGGNPCAAISLTIKMAQIKDTINFILKTANAPSKDPKTSQRGGRGQNTLHRISRKYKNCTKKKMVIAENKTEYVHFNARLQKFLFFLCLCVD